VARGSTSAVFRNGVAFDAVLPTEHEYGGPEALGEVVVELEAKRLFPYQA
jgi:hypothetical protein